MVEAELHFFQIEIEVFSAHAVITFQLGLCIAPEVLNAIYVIALAHGKGFLVIDAVMLEAIEHQPIIRAKAIGVDNTLRHNLRADCAVRTRGPGSGG